MVLSGEDCGCEPRSSPTTVGLFHFGCAANMSHGPYFPLEHDFRCGRALQRRRTREATGGRGMSIVHLPTCPMCKRMMRQVRICVRAEPTQATRYRVFECVRCHAELMWTPGMDQS